MRNTYDNKNPYTSKPNANQQQSKQRQTYTVMNPKQTSYQKQGPSKSNENNQKMTKNILEALKRLSVNNQNKSLGMTALKPNSKTLMNTIAVLLNSFDGMFEQSSLSVEMLPELFKSLGYPIVVNKTLFQPIGAQHTWPQCLMILQWLCQLAVFHVDIRCHLQQGQFGEDFTSMLIRAYLQNNIQIPKVHLQEAIMKKAQQIEDSMYHTNTHSLEIDNIKKSQKDITVMQEQKKRLESILKRQTQQVIQVSQQNYQMQRRMRQIQAKIQQQRKMSSIHDNQIISLTEEIQNQQLSVEQVQRIRFQIREYHQKITQLKRFYQSQKDNLDKIDGNIIDQYIEFNKALQVVRHMHRKHRVEMQRRNVYMTVPECEIGSFTQFVKARKQEWSEIRAEQLLGIKEVKEIKQKAQYLLNLISSEQKAIEQSRQQLHAQNRKLNEQCLQRAMKTNQMETQVQQSKQRLQMIKNKLSQTQLVNMQTGSQMTKIKEEIRQALIQQQQLIKQATQASRQGMQLGRLRISLQNEVNQSIARMEQRYNDYQFQFLQLLQNDCEYFQQSAEQECQEAKGECCLNQMHYEGTYNVVNNGAMLMRENQQRYDSRLGRGEVPRRMGENNRGFDSPPSERVNRLRDLGFGSRK